MSQAGHVQDRLSAYLDAELSSDERAAVERHLHACSACRDELAALRAVEQRVRDASPPAVAPQYWESFAARVDARLGEPARASQPAGASWLERIVTWFVPPGRFGWVRAAAAVASVTLLAYVAMRGFRAQDASIQAPLRTAPRAVTPATPETRAPFAQAPTQERDDAKLPGLNEQPIARFADEPELADEASESRKRSDVQTRAQPEAEGFGSKPSEGRANALQRTDAPPPVGDLDANAERLKKESAPSAAAPRSSATSEEPRRQPATGGGLQEREKAARELREVADEPSAADVLRQEAAPAPEAERKRVLQSVAELDRTAARLQAKQDADVTLAPDVVADLVRTFSAAALAGDVSAATRARESLARERPDARTEIDQMDAWRAAEALPNAVGRLQSPTSNRGNETSRIALRALDALVWPRREEPSFAPVVERMAEALEAASPEHPELRPRAHAYVTWLIERAEDDAAREHLRQRLDALSP